MTRANASWYAAVALLRTLPTYVICALLWGALLFVAFGQFASASERQYRLGPQDKVRFRVYEWRAARDEVFEWAALNQEFTIGAEGTVSLPLAGDVAAAGLLAGELASIVAERLRIQMGLAAAPDTSVEIVQFRPFYILGEVDRPGEYIYRPGLTVLQAVAIAGGIRRLNDFRPLAKELISGAGDLSLMTTQRETLLARAARLQAELSRAPALEPPLEVRRQLNSYAALAYQQEKLIFEARREAIITQVTALEQLKAFLEKEATSLQAQLRLEDTQLQLLRKELQSVSNLVEKGLAVAPRQLALERTVAQVESERLRVETSILRARQDISRTEISILELQNKRANETTADLRETEAKLEELARKLDTSGKMHAEAKDYAAGQLWGSGLEDVARVTYTLVRQNAEPRPASPPDLLAPGDTLRVDMRPAGPNDGSDVRSAPGLSKREPAPSGNRG